MVRVLQDLPDSGEGGCTGSQLLTQLLELVGWPSTFAPANNKPSAVPPRHVTRFRTRFRPVLVAHAAERAARCFAASLAEKRRRPRVSFSALYNSSGEEKPNWSRVLSPRTCSWAFRRTSEKVTNCGPSAKRPRLYSGPSVCWFWSEGNTSSLSVERSQQLRNSHLLTQVTSATWNRRAVVRRAPGAGERRASEIAVAQRQAALLRWRNRSLRA